MIVITILLLKLGGVMPHLVQIGNSRGIRIPKAIIEQADLEDKEIELKVVEEGLLLKPVRPTRNGWKEAFQAMSAAGDDELLLDDSTGNRFDEDEWQW
jgi:antitoxin MazE